LDKKKEKIKSVIEKIEKNIDTNRKKKSDSQISTSSVESIKQSILDDAQKSIDDLKRSMDEEKNKKLRGLNVDPSFDLNVSEKKAVQIDNYVRQGLRLGGSTDEEN